jgi:cell division septal protein FtsQ
VSKAQASVILIDLQEVDPELPTREDSEEAPAVSAPVRLLRTNGGILRTWGILLLGLAVLGAGGWWVSNSPLFDLRTLHISGNSHVTPGEVARIGGLDEHTNVIWFSSGKVEHSLEGNPWIKVARVSRTLPSVISVVIEERTPVAMVMPGAWLVASDGVVLGPARAGARLPEIDMPGADLRAGSRLSVASSELAVVGSLPPNLLRVVAKVSSRGGTLLLTLRSGVIVNYGDSSSLTEKSLALQAVLTWAARNGVRPISVDVRAPGSPALVPSPDKGH